MQEIDLKKVKIKYRYGAIACAGIDFSLKKGEKLAVVGDNASGKSSLLKLLAGLIENESGEFSIDGKPANTVAIKDRNAVFVQDRIALFDLRTVEYNLIYPLILRGESRTSAREKATAALKAVGLDLPIKTRVCRLSKEQKIKLCYARLFMRTADLYLIDDLYRELSDVAKAELLERISEWANEGEKTVVIATEKIDEAKRFTDTVLLLTFGVQTAYGNIESIAEVPPSLWAYKALLPEKEIKNARIKENDGALTLSVDDETFPLDKDCLLDGIFVGKDVLCCLGNNSVLIYDIKSSNLIYPIKQ